MLSSLRSSAQIHQILGQLDPRTRAGRERLRALKASQFLALRQLRPARIWRVVGGVGELLLAGALSVLLTLVVCAGVPVESRYLPVLVLLSLAGFGVTLASAFSYLRDSDAWTEYARQFAPLTDELSLAVLAVDILERSPKCRAYRDEVVARRPLVYRDLKAMRLLEKEVSSSDVSQGLLFDEQYRETIFRELRQAVRSPCEESRLAKEEACSN